ncbi:MAG: YihY/virulence factor BrkB family protein [Chloroflexota bacterium]|nr:YihY/virulence factor BrkB family protein [Chloroflexota bacterium]MDE2970493.1 YihY/virulence factor BrkB family protein [Chloroflexota bacterium]
MPTRNVVRSAAVRAMRGTRLLGLGATHLTREAVEGAIRAVGEVGGETRAFVRDAIVGVVEGTGQVVMVTTPAVREVVVGANRASRQVSGESKDIGREAVEGAVVGAMSVGIAGADAASAAAEGAVDAAVEAGGDLRDAAVAAVGGVVAGVSVAGGDIAEATRSAAYKLVTHDAVAEQGLAEVEGVSGQAVDAALQEAQGADALAEEVVVAAATGVVEAAYEVSQSHGDSVRRLVLRKLQRPQLRISPRLETSLTEVVDRLSVELPRGRAAWRVAAMVRAARILIQVGAIDLAGSLAYFTIMSFLPLVALAIMAIAAFGDPVTVSEQITELLIHYFPASSDLIREAVQALISGSLVFGVLAVLGIVLGANGLFMAADRSLRRIFGSEARRAVQITATNAVIAFAVSCVFLLSLGMTALLQFAVSFGAGLGVAGEFSRVTLGTLGAVSAVVPVTLTAAIFVIVYHKLPHAHVEWKDATYGAVVAIILFETGKHLFFWFTGFASQRNAVYGPASSVVVLMMWAYVASLIFLYGAALTRAAGELRPGRSAER